MSLATEFVPIVHIPEAARRCASDRLAGVTVLHRPSERSVAPPLRLTRLGAVVLATAVAVLAAFLVVLAWLSAPDGATGPTDVSRPANVTVRSGDSLWSIATRIAPQRDPRAELADLQRLNHLDATSLFPGELLRTR